MCWIIQTDKKRNVTWRMFPTTWRLFAAGKLILEAEGFIKGRGSGGSAEKGVSIPEPFIKACFSCLNLLVPVSVTVFIIQPQCANKPHMFRFSPYLSSQDKVEMSILQEICDRIHKYTHSGRGRGCVLLIFVFFNIAQDLHKEGTQ